MARNVRDTLNDLGAPTSVQVNSSLALVSAVDEHSASSDEKRRKAGKPILRRKPSLHPLKPSDVRKSIDLTPWEILHALARGLVLARHGTGRGLAEHWQSLKYCQALTPGRNGFLQLSDEGKMPEYSYKAMQSKELSLEFGLLATEHILKNRYPDHVISIVDASTALLAGWSLGGVEPSKGSRPRPEYFIEAWKPGEPSKVTLVGCKGNHEGLAEELYPFLENGRVEEYRRRAYDLRSEWQEIDTGEWRGPISFREDGTVMALRLLSNR